MMSYAACFRNKVHNMGLQAARLAMAGVLAMSSAMVCVILTPIPAAHGQELLSPGDWLDKLDREHNKLVSPAGHVHARGRVLDVDMERPGSITILIDAVESADKTIRMPAMEMPFHVTNRRMLQGLRPGDVIDFEAARLKTAVMITRIRKAY
jgi:Cu/Ag efflux protein CusF